MQMCNNGKKKCKVKFKLGTCCESGWKLFMNNLSLTKEKASFGLFFFLETTQAQIQVFGSTIKQAEFKHNNVFVKKLMNMHAQIFYMHTCP